ncbi:HesB/IscA family protein [Aquicella lusitana]|uniref:Iron-sulfur cluster assembly protein n=1 Tax=Aquicella lusitana TaxID=254246 RepID=A0A370GCB0_9COXI|nr:iron-sulfur cluster assembly accessory protein [Aquicella lusitana]RDI41337.1 iron-sulfur cluster assembly protein [Aquicella lusitana]VVC72297.1 Iron-sulfur cluster insertion protein ErpA [Aquicella lusitana]
MNPNIMFTNAAKDYIKKVLEKNKGVAFRLSVKKTGCSGYSYFPAVVEQINPADFLIELDGLKILVDPLWLHLFNGLQVDYLEEEKSGLKQKRLQFNNPNESSRCGCGESFHIE